MTSENAQEVVESLAEARLCRGEACLARRIDAGDRYSASPAITDNDVLGMNNRNMCNTCAPHTTGESGFAPTLNHWRARHASPLQSRQGRITSNFKLPT